MFIECVGYCFVGVLDIVVEGYCAVGVCGGGEFVVEGFNGIPVGVLIVFVVPWCIHMGFPDVLFMFGYVLIYFVVEFGDEGVIGIDVS